MNLVNPLKNLDSHVYHYTSSDTALRYVLGDGSLRLNSYRNVNDPRESKSWVFSPCVRSTLNLELREYEEISINVSEIMKGNAKLLCFSRDRPEAVGAWQPSALLDRGFAKPNMWHHYANSHDGVCFMFNREKLERVIHKKLSSGHLFHGSVIYSNEGILPNFATDPFAIDLTWVRDFSDYIQAISYHFDRWHKKLFLQKLADWACEDEYRWVFLDDNPEPVTVDYEDALEAIVIGEKVSDENYEDFLRHGGLHEAEVVNLDWHNGYPKIGRIAQPHITHRHLLSYNF